MQSHYISCRGENRIFQEIHCRNIEVNVANLGDETQQLSHRGQKHGQARDKNKVSLTSFNFRPDNMSLLENYFDSEF